MRSRTTTSCEGTATLVQDRYQHRYLGDDLPIGQRIEGARSLIVTNPGAYAVNAEAIFDYVDAALFVHNLYQRTGDWRLVDRALRTPGEKRLHGYAVNLVRNVELLLRRLYSHC